MVFAVPTYVLTINDIQNQFMAAMQADDRDGMAAVYQKMLAFAAKVPKEWAVWFQLGNWHLAQDRFMEALPYFVLAWELHPGFPEDNPKAGKKDPGIAQNIGSCYRGEHQQELAEQWYLVAAEIEPENADVWNNLGTLYVNEGNPQKAAKYLSKAVKLNPGLHHAHWNLSLALLEMGDWERGFPEYSWGLEGTDRLIKRYTPDLPWWHGEPVNRLLVYGEQGIGDEIMYATLLKRLLDRGLAKEIVLDCHDRLELLFRDAFEDLPIEIHGTRKLADEDPMWDHHADAKVAIGQIPQWLISSEDELPKTPYLKIPTDINEDFVETTRTVVGVSWVGGAKTTRKEYRSAGLKAILEGVLEYIPDALFVSTQYTDHSSDVAECGIEVKEFPGIFQSIYPFERYYPTTEPNHWQQSRLSMQASAPLVLDHKHALPAGGHKDETGAIYFEQKDSAKEYCRVRYGHSRPFHWIDPHGGYDYRRSLWALDRIVKSGGLLIGVNNSMVHLAGAAGLPYFCLTPAHPAWRYGMRRRDMPFYAKSSVRQYRQTEQGDWAPAVAAAGKAMLKLKRRRLAA